MKKFWVSLACMAVFPLLAGCPASQQQSAAQASLQAATIVQAAQQAEISFYQQGIVSPSEHQFIEEQFLTLATTGKTVDACIGAASSKGAVFVCLNAAIAAVDQINTNGGAYLKSAQAKQEFSLAISGVRGVLASIEATLGGAPPIASAN